jgi:hypothetical protein
MRWQVAELFRHRDVGDPSDELYVLEVNEKFPDLGLHFGCHNPDQHSVVQLRPEAIDKLLGALIEWKARRLVVGDER